MRRRSIGLAVVIGAASAVAVVVLVVVGRVIMTAGAAREVRQPGEWRFVSVVADDRWPLQQRILTHDTADTMVTAPTGTTCVVSTESGRLPAAELAAGRPIRIGLRSGVAVDTADGTALRWSYATGAVAEVRCFEPVPESVLHDLARRVDFRESPVLLPFRLASLPEGYHVATIDERRAGADVAISLQPAAGIEKPSVIIRYGADQIADRCLRQPAGQPICVSTSWSTEDAPFASARANQAVRDVLDRLVPAADPGDSSTWFDARDLPR